VFCAAKFLLRYFLGLGFEPETFFFLLGLFFFWASGTHRISRASWAIVLFAEPSDGLQAAAAICWLPLRRVWTLDLEVDGAFTAASTDLSMLALLMPYIPPCRHGEIHTHLSLESIKFVVFDAPNVSRLAAPTTLVVFHRTVSRGKRAFPVTWEVELRRQPGVFFVVVGRRISFFILRGLD